MTRIAELRQHMAATNEQIQSMLAKSRDEKRALNTEEQASFDKASADITATLKTIEAEERAAEFKAKLADSEAERQQEKRKLPESENLTKEQRVKQAWNLYLRFGLGAMDEEQRSTMTQFRSRETVDATMFPPGSAEYRALSIVTNTAGQYTVPTEWEANVVKAMKDYSGVLDANPTIITTNSGNPLAYPTMNDTSNVGAILAENTATAEQDVAFGQKILGAYKYTSKMIKVPLELLQDSAVDIEALLRAALAERLGRVFNQHLTTGDGSTQPEGVVTAATLGKTAAAAVAFTSNEILDLIHSVDPAYRPGSRLMFHDTTLKAILQLTDSQNRPLFQPSNRDLAPATVHGYQFSINNDMAVPAAAARFMLFGNFKYHLVRRVSAIDLVRLNERYAESYQVAFVGFARMDAKFIDASGGAVKYMRNA